MDILNSLSRWIVGKRGEMHQLFEQCSQGYPRKEASVVGAAKRLTHSQTEGGVLDILRRLPMGMAMGIGMDSVTSDKYPHQMGPMDSMRFPVVGPKGVPDMGSLPPYSQCLGGNPGSVIVSPAKNNISQQQNLKQPSLPHTDPGKYHDVFQYTGTKTTLPQANQPKVDHFQELSKSSMWKHIFAPPFTPASAKNKYPYSMADPAHPADLSHLYPYANRAETAIETMHMGPARGHPSGGYPPGASCFMSHMETLGSECQAFSPTPAYSFARPFVPCYISVIGQPSPLQVQQCQHIFISPPHRTLYYHQAQQAFPGTTHRPFHTTSAYQSAPSPTQYTQTVRGKIQPPATPSKQDDPSTISEVVNGIESLHVSPKIDMPKAHMNPTSAPVDSQSQRVHSLETTALQSTSMELDCDNQLQADTAKLDSSESALSDNKNNKKCAQVDSNMNEHEPRIESGQEMHTPKSQPHKSSSNNKDCNIFRHPCTTTPNTNPRKKRKCRPSAEKRRRRRMPAVCAVSTKQTPTRPSSEAASSSKKLKTDHVAASEEAPSSNTMSASVAFILGLDSEEEVEETENTKANLMSNPVKPSHVKSFCFTISSDSDSDFDDISDGSDTTDGLMDELMWGGLNFSLDPFKFQCLSSTPIPIKKTMSSPQLTPCSSYSEAEANPLSWSPTRRTSLGKHVKFASGDLLVTVHTIEDELEAYQEARKGDWEQFARDRCRFKDRSEDIEKAISWVFDPDHRARVQRLLQSSSQSSSSQ